MSLEDFLGKVSKAILKLRQTKPPYAREKLTGVFATRSEYRPNPIAMTTCKMLKVDEKNGTIEVSNIDAYDGTPIVDLKAYRSLKDIGKI